MRRTTGLVRRRALFRSRIRHQIAYKMVPCICGRNDRTYESNGGDPPRARTRVAAAVFATRDVEEVDGDDDDGALLVSLLHGDFAICAAGTDAGTDYGTDYGTDGGTDDGTNAGTYAGTKAGTDAGTYAGTEADTCRCWYRCWYRMLVQRLIQGAGTDAGTDYGIQIMLQMVVQMLLQMQVHMLVHIMLVYGYAGTDADTYYAGTDVGTGCWYRCRYRSWNRSSDITAGEK